MGQPDPPNEKKMCNTFLYLFAIIILKLIVKNIIQLVNKSFGKIEYRYNDNQMEFIQ